MNLIRAIGAVGSALERHSRGHKFEPCIAHHKKSRAVRALFFMRYNRRELVLKRSVAKCKQSFKGLKFSCYHIILCCITEDVSIFKRVMFLYRCKGNLFDFQGDFRLKKEDILWGQ